MADMLVRLYALPDSSAACARARREGVTIRRPQSWERTLLVDWVRETFSQGWADECAIAFATQPPSCLVAVHDSTLVGFACHDCTRRNFFGPAGVDPAMRGAGVGRRVLAALTAESRARGDHTLVLHAMLDVMPFYAASGFTATSAPFDEAGIPHVAMSVALG